MLGSLLSCRSILLVIVFAISQSLSAQEVLVLGNESMPFNGIVNGENAGMTFEILDEATKYGAPAFRFQLGLPWKRAQQILEHAGDAPTAIVPFTRTEQREENYLWIAQLLSYQTRLSTTDKTNNLILESVKQKPIGIIRGSAHIPLLEKLGFERVSFANKAIQNSTKLAKGYIYAIVESQFVDVYHWKKLDRLPQDLQFLPLGEEKHIYIAGNLSFPRDVAEKISDAINKMRANGRLDEILKRWEQ